MTLFEPLHTYIESELNRNIPEQRKPVLQPLIDFIQSKQNGDEVINLNFVCTHNSRRSHLSQVWAQVMSAYFRIQRVYCYSAGTEATAVFPKILATLASCGLEVSQLASGDNPVYAIKYAHHLPTIVGFSKTLDHEFNPTEQFAAIMTCSQADEGCPFIPRAESRIPITYEDPKISDGTPEQTAVYLQRSTQIASEMYYVFSKIK